MQQETLTLAARLVKANQLDEAIALAEADLQRMPLSPFHKMIGKDLSPLIPHFNSYLIQCHSEAMAFYSRNDIETDTFYRINPATFQQELVTRTIDWSTRSLRAIYCEMNGFEINYDLWFLNFFAYSHLGDIENLDWLSDYQYENEKAFVISGLEDMQEAYRQFSRSENRRALQDTADACTLLILLRLQQLFHRAFISASGQNLAWTATPIFVTAHDWDMVYRAAI